MDTVGIIQNSNTQSSTTTDSEVCSKPSIGKLHVTLHLTKNILGVKKSSGQEFEKPGWKRCESKLGS